MPTCRECGNMLRRDGTCPCQSPPAWVGEKTNPTNRCDRCNDTSHSVNTFPEDGHPDDRSRRLCPSCWIPALKRRVEYDQAVNKGRCPECGKSGQEHVAEVKTLLRKIQVRWVTL